MTEILDTVLIVVHIMLVVVLIGLVLLQKSEGGALGIGGGGGGGGGGFMSARGAADALTKTTTIVAAAFFLTSILLGVTAKNASRTESVIERIENAPDTGVPTTAGEQSAPSGGSLLDDLNSEGNNNSGVPTSQ